MTTLYCGALAEMRSSLRGGPPFAETCAVAEMVEHIDARPPDRRAPG